jgi:hypothetical protein
MIPESQHLNSVADEKFFTSVIPYQCALIVMTAAIQLNRQLCSRAIEVEYVSVQRVLATKLVTCEIAIP